MQGTLLPGLIKFPQAVVAQSAFDWKDNDEHTNGRRAQVAKKLTMRTVPSGELNICKKHDRKYVFPFWH